MTTGTLGYDFNDKLPSRYETNAATRCGSLAPDTQWRPKNAGFERDFVCFYWDIPCSPEPGDRDCKDHDMIKAIVEEHDPNAAAEVPMPDDGRYDTATAV
jgi:hypothetical protein